MKKINKRVNALCKKMETSELTALLVSKPENIRYLSNFSGGSDARLLITLEKQYILTDGRYYEQVEQECPDWQLVKESQGGISSVEDLCAATGRLGVEGHYISVDFWENMKKDLSLSIIPISGWIEMQRIVKDETELACLRSAAEVGDQVFSRICHEIDEGVSERYIAAKIAFMLKEGGCSGESFDTIAVAGENAALPHGQPSSRLLRAGDMLTMDFGGFFQGYAGDMTRTVAIKQAPSRLRDIYAKLLEAQELGVQSVRSGIQAKEVDEIVRGHLKKAELDQYFLHGLGHGVGLEIHEQPRLSYTSDTILEENMVVTVEPGVYIPGWGGIRIEDTVIVKSGGCEVITHSDKKLIIL